jgi:hypothetical protein
MRHQGSRTQYQSLLTGEASVSFESIRKEKFDRFRPPHLGLESLMVWQTEWFANMAGTTIGTLAVGKANQGWNYAVLGRDKSGDFRVYKLGRDAFSLDDARDEFLLEMAAAEKSQAGEYEKEKRASPSRC